ARPERAPNVDALVATRTPPPARSSGEASREILERFLEPGVDAGCRYAGASAGRTVARGRDALGFVFDLVLAAHDSRAIFVIIGSIPIAFVFSGIRPVVRRPFAGGSLLAEW